MIVETGTTIQSKGLRFITLEYADGLKEDLLFPELEPSFILRKANLPLSDKQPPARGEHDWIDFNKREVEPFFKKAVAWALDKGKQRNVDFYVYWDNPYVAVAGVVWSKQDMGA